MKQVEARSQTNHLENQENMINRRGKKVTNVCRNVKMFNDFKKDIDNFVEERLNVVWNCIPFNSAKLLQG